MPPMISAQATGLTVSGSDQPALRTTRPTTAVTRKAAPSLNTYSRFSRWPKPVASCSRRWRNTSTTARIAPAWMMMLKKSDRAPSQCWAISRWPVLEIGRNSVKPSRMPSSRAESRSDMDGADAGGGRSSKE
ncbi:hypothetical protein D3C73_1214160 [compost metagenome]